MTFNRAIPRVAVITLAASAAFAAAPVAAADKAVSDNPKFDQLDKNHDGFITRDEVRGIPGFGKAFDEADENKDGKLDRAEFIKADAIHDRIVAGTYVDDSVVTAKVKAALFKEPDLKSLDVSVETLRGEVLLSGFVKDESQREKAMKAAIRVNGVASVKDAMVVR
ncbi:MAG TPA: BON domain-containing protein [Burkholderiales bacterium]|nr:BON domain-containing protein [Burkholderiales bacterium]